MENKGFLYTIFVFFCIISIWLILTKEGGKSELIYYLTLLSFGGGGLVYFVLTNDKIANKIKRFASLLGCLIFILVCYYLLPFHHLFDGARKYTPEIGWIIGLGGMLFFGLGFFKLLFDMLKDHFKK